MTAHDFRFISVDNPADAKNPDKRRMARSHAVRHAIQKRRKSQQESSFDAASAIGSTLVPWSVFAPASAYGPFETLFGDSPKLKALLSRGKFRNSLS